MGAVGRLAALPCGKVSKWIVLALWIVAVAVSFGPAGKLTGAQDNDSVSWLPGNAESTEVLKASERFGSPDEIPAVLLDTIIVRSVLVTALNLDIGRYLWWPGTLAQRHDVEPDGEAPEPEPQRSLAGS